MGKKKINYAFKDTFQTVVPKDCAKTGKITFEDFIELHGAFMADKAPEGLAQRTLEEHAINLNYFLNYVKNNVQSDLNCVAVDGQLFKTYLYFIRHEKEYSPFTVNIRLGTIKCYLKWLYENNHIEENINMKLKLVNTPMDTVRPLKDAEVKKLLKACDMEPYTGFRDYAAMVLILDCGIRSKELVQLKINFENSLPEISKTKDETFIRMWRLYLNACAASFNWGNINIHQILFTKDINNNLPWTREYMYN
jgi:integrase/recombinase XerD